MSADEKRQVGRLALRVEGHWWVAYYALPNTMEGAFELGRVAMGLVQDRSRKQAFMDLMRDGVAEFLTAATGTALHFNVLPAPEHERAGRA